MKRITCPWATVAQTLELLRTGGAAGHEHVVLWLAAASRPEIVAEVYDPEQVTARDRFRIPPSGMLALSGRLRADRLRVAAQIHTHPGPAFHSEADNEWAIVRHVGALSLVLPRFAATTDPDSFLDDAMTYELSAAGAWLHVPNRGTDARLEITP